MKDKLDLIIVGAGPAGMMMAGKAAENGARVLLLEKNSKPGIKLLITGNRRCNIVNAESEIKKVVKKFGPGGKFLYSSLSRFSGQDVVGFFEELGVKTKVEAENRVFPISDKSTEVLAALTKYLQKNNVEVRTDSEVKKFVASKNIVKRVVLKSGEKFEASNFAICTGGKSYPMTGSSGDGYSWLKKMGHHVIPPTPSLVPIYLKEEYIKQLEGLSFKEIQIDIYQGGKKKDSRLGEAIFTAGGMSGPIIMDMSKSIGDFLKKGTVQVKLDFCPDIEFKDLDKKIQNTFGSANKMFRNSLDSFLPKKIIPIIVKMSGIVGSKQVNSITKQERNKLIHLIKEFEMEVEKIGDFDKAIVTAGGIDLKEVDPKTMKSKIISNLYLAGEILDIDGPTGGYNLEACWTTGYMAGDSMGLG